MSIYELLDTLREHGAESHEQQLLVPHVMVTYPNRGGYPGECVMRFGKKLVCLAAFMMVPAFATAPAQYGDKDVIEYRKHIMSALNEQSKAIGQILAGTVPDDNAVAHLESLALTASVALKAFEPKAEGGEANPEVWSNWADFSKRMNELARKTADMAKVAREKGKDAGMQSIADALTCKSCHDVYRSGFDADE